MNDNLSGNVCPLLLFILLLIFIGGGIVIISDMNMMQGDIDVLNYKLTETQNLMLEVLDKLKELK